jgi:hypothetical protein
VGPALARQVWDYFHPLAASGELAGENGAESLPMELAS